jgi:putative transposase
MTNHVHLLLTPRRAELVPKLVISLGRRYVQYVNRRYGRTGTLWDSRYKSSLVHAETYLLACQRYIELNPVRAGMEEEPGHYRWTSYHANAMGQPDAALTPHPLYLALGREPEERRATYRELLRAPFAHGTLSVIRLALGQCQPLGDARFHAEIEQRTGVRRESRPRGRPPAKPGHAATK